MANLTKYQEMVISNDDRPLFDEAVLSADVNAYRGAYILVWLSCVESLKRKFHEASKRDDVAGKTIGKIKEYEKDKKSTDMLILSKARNYGFIDDSVYQALENIYKMRCIYGHPYEKAPSKADLKQAASTVATEVLSKPTTLKHGFAETLLKNLMEDVSYLDDYEVPIFDFAKETVQRIDVTVHPYLVEKYLGQIDDKCGDPTMRVFINRAVWFLRSFLIETGCDIFDQAKWHDLVTQFPSITMQLFCNEKDLFMKIGKRAQDSIVGSLVTDVDKTPSKLRQIEHLYKSKALSSRQEKRFLGMLNECSINVIFASLLSTETCVPSIIKALKSNSWYTQNPAVDIVFRNGSDQLSTISSENLVILGRNILQAADGSAGSANSFLRDFKNEPNKWPADLLKGITLELFVNEKDCFRLKDRKASIVFEIIQQRSDGESIVTCLMKAIVNSKQKQVGRAVQVENCIKKLEQFPRAKPVVAYLTKLQKELEVEEAA